MERIQLSKKVLTLIALFTSVFTFAQFTTTGAAPNTITSNTTGNVGIGTTTPNARLTLRGQSSIFDTNSPFSIQNSSGTSLLDFRNNGNIGLGIAANSAVKLYTKSTANDFGTVSQLNLNQADLRLFDLRNNGNIGLGIQANDGVKLYAKSIANDFTTASQLNENQSGLRLFDLRNNGNIGLGIIANGNVKLHSKSIANDFATASQLNENQSGLRLFDLRNNGNIGFGIIADANVKLYSKSITNDFATASQLNENQADLRLFDLRNNGNIGFGIIADANVKLYSKSIANDFATASQLNVNQAGSRLFDLRNNGNIGLGVIADINTRLQVATGGVRFQDLAGTGSRMVVADTTGKLSTQVIPSGIATTNTLTISPTQQLTSTVNGIASTVQLTIPPSVTENIYNTNGALTTNRNLSLNDKTLGFYGNTFSQVYNPLNVPTGSSEESFSTISNTSPGNVGSTTEIFMSPSFNHGYFKLRGIDYSSAVDGPTKNSLLNFGVNQSSSWLQSSIKSCGGRSQVNCSSIASDLLLNPLGGNVGIGVNSPTSQLHTINSVRFENLPFNKEKPNAILGTDMQGNVYNYEPSLFSSGASQDVWLLNGNSSTIPGTGIGENFIGTTDQKDLVFGVNAQEKLRITQSGRLKFFNSDAAPTWYSNLYIGGGNENTSSLADGYNYANVGVGLASLASNTTGYANTAFGYNTLQSNLTSSLNSAFGINSLQKHIAGNANVSVGHNSMREHIEGLENTAMGNSALISNITGSNNIAIGSYAGVNLVNGNSNIFIGTATPPTAGDVSNELNIGNWIFGKNGQIAIGSFTDLPQAFNTNSDYQLIVKQGIRTEKVRVDVASVKNWADYVFDKEYKLMPLKEVEQFIATNGHLPNIPKAEEVVKTGIDLGTMDVKLLEKIEELTLHTIELNKINETQQKTIDDLVHRLEQLEKKAKQ